jgi:hypothetical protein
VPLGWDGVSYWLQYEALVNWSTVSRLLKCKQMDMKDMWRISIGPSTRFGNLSACKAVLRRIKSPYSLHFIIESFAKAFMGILPSFLAKGLLGSPSCHLFRRTYQFIFAACITLLLLWTPLGSVANLTLVLVELCTVGLFIGDCFSGRWLCRKNCGGRRILGQRPWS